VPSHGRGDAVTRWSHAARDQSASQTRAHAVRSIVSASASSSNNLRMATPGELLVNTGPIYDERRTPYANDVTGTCPVDYRSESLSSETVIILESPEAHHSACTGPRDRLSALPAAELQLRLATDSKVPTGP
jgi:hypothetical protein